MASIVDLPHVYNISVNKYRNFQEREGLRKFALINNFLYTKFETLEQEPLEWSEESVKKDEENWLDACLDSLDEEEKGYVYIKLIKEDDDAMEIEGQDSDIHITEDIIISDDLLHLSYFPNTTHMAIDKDVEGTLIETYETVETHPGKIGPQKDEDVNMVDCFEYWKDNSIIAATPPSEDFFNFSDIPPSFQRYRLGRDDVIVRPLDSCAVLSLLDHKYQQPPSHLSDNKRSKDDLDLLCSLSLLGFRGEKRNDSSNPPSSLEDDKLWFI